MFKFGEKVRDTITGFEGVIIGRAEYANGSKQYGVQGLKLGKDDAPTDVQWIEQDRFERIEG